MSSVVLTLLPVQIYLVQDGNPNSYVYEAFQSLEVNSYTFGAAPLIDCGDLDRYVLMLARNSLELTVKNVNFQNCPKALSTSRALISVSSCSFSATYTSSFAVSVPFSGSVVYPSGGGAGLYVDKCHFSNQWRALDVGGTNSRFAVITDSVFDGNLNDIRMSGGELTITQVLFHNSSNVFAIRDVYNSFFRPPVVINAFANITQVTFIASALGLADFQLGGTMHIRDSHVEECEPLVVARGSIFLANLTAVGSNAKLLDSSRSSVSLIDTSLSDAAGPVVETDQGSLVMSYVVLERCGSIISSERTAVIVSDITFSESVSCNFKAKLGLFTATDCSVQNVASGPIDLTSVAGFSLSSFDVSNAGGSYGSVLRAASCSGSLTGFTMSGGVASQGAIYLEDSNVQLVGSSVTSLTGTEGSVFHARFSTVTVSGTSFTDNIAQSGAVVYATSCELVLENCQFNNNKGTISGGVVFASSTTFSVIDSTFLQNSAPIAGVLFLQPFSVSNISNCSFEHNSASHSGGVFSASFNSQIIVSDSIFADNHADVAGGCFDCDMSSVIISDSSFVRQHGLFDGGLGSAMLCALSFSASTISDCSARVGGVLRLQSSNASLDSVDASYISAEQRGGFLWGSDSQVDAVNCNLQHSQSATGGLLMAESGSVFTLSSSVFFNVTSDLGAIHAVESTVTMDSVEITYANSSSDGGAIHASDSMVTVSGSTISECHARNGGAVFATGGSVEIESASVLSSCSATLNGGIVYASDVSVSGGSSLSDGSSTEHGGCVYMKGGSVSSSTITGCSANTGGCLYISAASAVTVTGTTLSFCDALGGGAVFSDDVLPTIVSPTYASNSAIFGANYASVPAAIVVSDPNFLSGLFPAQYSEGTTLCVEDAYGQVVATLSDSVSITNVTDEIQILQGSSFSLSSGCASIDKIQIAGAQEWSMAGALAISLFSTNVPQEVIDIDLVACPDGFQYENGLCLACPADFHNPAVCNSTHCGCEPCPMGTEKLDEGGHLCQACPAGYFRNSSFTSCQPCSERYYQSLSGQSECLICPAGHYCDSEALATPVSCTGSTAATDPGSLFCTPCPSRSAPVAGYSSCRCESQLRLDTDVDECVECRYGGVCDGTSYVSVAEGFWRAEEEDVLFACELDGCREGDHFGDDGCAEGYSGTLCALCGSDRVRVGDTCVPCITGFLGVLVLLLVVLAIAGVIWVMISSANNSKAKSSILLRIVINHLQVVSMLGEFKLAWPAVLNSFFGIAGGASAVLPTSTLGCYVPSFTFYSSFVLVALLPLVIAGFGLGWFWFVDRSQKTKSGAQRESRVLQNVLVMLFFLFPLLAKTTLAVYDCTVVAGDSFVAKDFRLSCSDGGHALFAYLSFILFCLFCLGFPLSCLIIIHRNEKKLASAKAKMDAHVANNMLERLSFLRDGYRIGRGYWESVTMLRKLAFVVAATLLRQEPRLQGYAGSWIMFVFVALHLFAQPNESRQVFHLELVSLVGLFVTLSGGLLLSEPSVDNTGLTVTTWVLMVVNLGIVALLLWYFITGKRKEVMRARCFLPYVEDVYTVSMMDVLASKPEESHADFEFDEDAVFDPDAVSEEWYFDEASNQYRHVSEWYAENPGQNAHEQYSFYDHDDETAYANLGYDHPEGEGSD